MRRKLLSCIIWPLLLSQVASRPRETEPVPGTLPVSKRPDEDARSRLDAPDYESMDQSLRTMTTQLLNVTAEGDKSQSEKIQPKLGLLIRKADRTIPPAGAVNDNQKDDVELVKEVTAVTSGGRLTNSKYNYFESSHPGQAMAMTEEDLEKEMASTRFSTFKGQPTTSGGLSTWILLNPPSSTKSPEPEVTPTIKDPTSLPPTEAMEPVKTTTQKPAQKTTVSKPPSPKKPAQKPEKTSPSTTSTTPRAEGRSTTSSSKTESTTPRITTKKITTRNPTKSKPTTTAKPTTIASKTTTMKVVKPTQSRPPKPPTRKPTPKPDVKAVNSTSKIEKVTFKPVQMITTPKSHIEAVPKPSTFSAKIQASIKTDIKPTQASKEPPKSEKPTPKPNNVLKVHLKKPVDTPTTIEIDPIKVSAPVLTIEKLGEPEDTLEPETNSSDPVPSSQIDVKFDFTPELAKPDTIESTKTTTAATSTKRPKTSSKRKKHKTRRRRPSTTSSSITSVSTVAEVSPQPEAASALAEISVQESKVVPESNSTKHKKKQVAKPITTQIYNFISREVMPSVGVMSLVGLGLGLASYFLYPFGGAIARRNYEVEPNYKYNLDEYGGNYGQTEEEVFNKVLQGMNTNDGKHGGIKNLDNNNYYRYQAYDGAYTDHSTRKADPRFPTSSVPVYRPDKTPLPYDLKYRNTGFGYSDSTTPTYQRKSDYGQANVDRQFVVGSVPKDYESEEKILQISTTESGDTDFERQIAQSLQFAQNPQIVQNSQGSLTVNSNYDQPEAQPLKSESYDDIEITPAAVAVEHGPRSLIMDILKPQDEPATVFLKSADGEISPPAAAIPNGPESLDNSAVHKDSLNARSGQPEHRPLEADRYEDTEITSAALAAERGPRTLMLGSLKSGTASQLLKSDKSDVSQAGPHDAVVEHAESIILDTLKGLTAKKRRKRDSVIQLIPSRSDIEKEEKEIATEEPLSNEIVDIIDAALPEDMDQKKVKKEKKPIAVVKKVTTDKPEVSTTEMEDEVFTTTMLSTKSGENPHSEGVTPPTTAIDGDESFSIFNVVKKVAEIKFRLGLTIIKHASESLARYIGHVQKRINGDE